MAGAALAVAVLVGGWLDREPPYRHLFAIQDEKDGGQIVAALTSRTFPPLQRRRAQHPVPQTVATPGSSSPLAGTARRAACGLRTHGEPEARRQPVCRAENYQRALEASWPLGPVAGRRARRPRIWRSPSRRPSARRPENLGLGSGQPARGTPLEPVQVAGIVNLVASSVPHLNPLNVTVIDQEGSSPSSATRCATPGSTLGQLKHVREVESDYGKRIEAILAPVVGASNVRAQVTADIDFSQIDQVAETYKPNPRRNGHPQPADGRGRRRCRVVRHRGGIPARSPTSPGTGDRAIDPGRGRRRARRR